MKQINLNRIQKLRVFPFLTDERFISKKYFYVNLIIYLWGVLDMNSLSPLRQPKLAGDMANGVGTSWR